MDAPVLLKNFVGDSQVVAEAGTKLDVSDPTMGERFGGVARGFGYPPSEAMFELLVLSR